MKKPSVGYYPEVAGYANGEMTIYQPQWRQNRRNKPKRGPNHTKPKKKRK